MYNPRDITELAQLRRILDDIDTIYPDSKKYLLALLRKRKSKPSNNKQIGTLLKLQLICHDLLATGPGKLNELGRTAGLTGRDPLHQYISLTRDTLFNTPLYIKLLTIQHSQNAILDNLSLIPGS